MFVELFKYNGMTSNLEIKISSTNQYISTNIIRTISKPKTKKEIENLKYYKITLIDDSDPNKTYYITKADAERLLEGQE